MTLHTVFLVTADDIEDHSTVAVFSSKEAAEAFNNAERQKKKDKFYANRGPHHMHLEWDDKYFYGDVEKWIVQ